MAHKLCKNANYVEIGDKTGDAVCSEQTQHHFVRK